MNLRGAKPVVDNSVKKFITELQPMNDLYNDDIPKQFINNFVNWIKNSKLNNLQGLEEFTNRKLCAGTAQAFDHFYWRYQHRRFRFFNAEFMYHSAFLRSGGNYEYLEKCKLKSNDVVIISVPYSDTGSMHLQLEDILNTCNRLGCPVLLDFAYYPCSRNIKLDLSKYPCVETLTFSISKAFYGAEFLRVGLRLEKTDTDDGIDIFNSVEMLNRVSISIANSLLENYSVDYNWSTYQEVYETVCAEKNLKHTDCIMFGLGCEEYQDYNRGGTVNRVCVSELIGEKINGNSK